MRARMYSSACCLALVVVLAALLLAAAWAVRLYLRVRDAEGYLPFVRALSSVKIAYPPSLPAGLPGPAFDPRVAAFAERACFSAANRRIGADLQLPRGLEEVGWAGDHALFLSVTGTPLFVVAVAGTMTDADVRADAQVEQTDFYGARAHGGFVRLWGEVYPAVRALVEAVPGGQFLITGHSLGAAVATLVAAALGADYPGLALALYSLATPRAGDDGLVRLLARGVPNRWHVANRADLVPTIPFSVTPTKVSRNPLSGTGALYADYDRVAYFDAQAGSLLGNHLMDAYLCGLEGGDACAAMRWHGGAEPVSFPVGEPGPAAADLKNAGGR